jgi:hypothetical protein
MKKLLLLLSGVILCFFSPARSGVRIVQFDRSGNLTWTNLVGNAAYRVQSSSNLISGWIDVTNTVAASASVSITVPTDPGAKSVFYRVKWDDPPAAVFAGDWIYQGWDPNGNLVVTGLVNISATEPVQATATFQSIAGPSIRHPVGTGSTTNITLSGTHNIQIALPTGFQRDGFNLSGQVLMDEFSGTWSFTDQIVTPFEEGLGALRSPGIVIVSGQFVAKRKQ